MGGSGGGWYKAPRAVAVARAQQAAAAAMEMSGAASYTATVNDLLSDELKDCNGRDAQAVATHVENLKDAINQIVEDGQVQLLFGGSVRKHTFVDGLSDIDLLVVLNDSSLANKTPEEVLAAFAARIQQRLGGRTPVKVGALAVTVAYADGIEIQLLPALRTPTGLRIKVPFKNEWSKVVRPQAFAQKLTEVNKACANNVVPVIKLYKSLQSGFVRANQLSGYHVESLAIETFKNYSGGRSLKSMFLHFLETTAQRVLNPIRDHTGQSLHVDDKLGEPNSPERMRIHQRITRIAVRLRAADAACETQAWRELFDND